MTNTIYILIYCAIMLIAGLTFARSKSLQDFLIASRSNPGIIMAAGIVIGSIDAMWFIFFSGMAYSIGWAFLFVIGGILLGIVALHSKTASIKALSTEANMHTLPDWFRYKYGRKTAAVLGILVALNFLGWITAIVASAGVVLSTMFGVSYTIAVLGVAAVALPLLLKGGYATLTKFDVLQFVIVAIGLGFVWLIGTDRTQANFAWPLVDSIGTLGTWGAVSLTLSMFSTCFAAGDLWQRIYAARGMDEARKGFKYAYLFFAASLLATACIGYLVKASGFTGAEDQVFSYYISHLLSPAGKGIFLIILLAAIISSLNVGAFAGAATLAKDFSLVPPDEPMLTRRIKWIMTGIIFLACLLALTVPNIMTLGLAVLSAASCAAALLFLSLYTDWKISDDSAAISVMAAMAVYVYLVVSEQMVPENSGIPLLVNLAALAVAEAYRRRRAA